MAGSAPPRLAFDFRTRRAPSTLRDANMATAQARGDAEAPAQAETQPQPQPSGQKTHSSMPPALQTPRLRLRPLDARRDAAAMLALLTDAAWLRFIGDRGVRSEAEAARYIEQGSDA
jgi:hypothetical protein